MASIFILLRASQRKTSCESVNPLSYSLAFKNSTNWPTNLISWIKSFFFNIPHKIFTAIIYFLAITKYILHDYTWLLRSVCQKRNRNNMHWGFLHYVCVLVFESRTQCRNTLGWRCHTYFHANLRSQANTKFWMMVAGYLIGSKLFCSLHVLKSRCGARAEAVFGSAGPNRVHITH